GTRGRRATRSRRGWRRAASRSDLLPRIKQVLRIERSFDGGVKLIGARTELSLEPGAFHSAHAVLPRDRAAETQCQREQLLRHLRRSGGLLGVVAVEQIRRVQVPVSRMPP